MAAARGSGCSGRAVSGMADVAGAGSSAVTAGIARQQVQAFAEVHGFALLPAAQDDDDDQGQDQQAEQDAAGGDEGAEEGLLLLRLELGLGRVEGGVGLVGRRRAERDDLDRDDVAAGLCRRRRRR